jgi:hypothetical protein
MSEKKYIMAIVQIPIEVNNENEHHTMSEYISVSFDRIDTLPNKTSINFNYDTVKQLLNNFLQETSPISESEEIVIEEQDAEDNEKNEIAELTVTVDEIKSNKGKPTAKDITFRNRKSSSSRYSRKVN